ncbi:regulatory protein RecX [Bdellovibrio bacteriovorus]|uniref:Regulatory protein RecX n=1 Tax=Bdellovibrio bacteriovorus str. Tiberius TaxID=1069642 RepID=K7YRH1_BDEBC|nr:regulatory protein RecX [Bdellovibrio bacteriovorus]AFY00198.1 regulatory protein RecX [Bdellovibrio bacteriovorus str. Tiberius]
MSREKDPLKTRQYAKKKVMDMIARRDHSEKELRTKLKEKFSDEEDVGDIIDEAIEFAKDNRWLGDPVDLAHRLADMLHRRNKGIYYINNYLKEKGLPAVETDRALELEKALAIVKNKYDEDHKFSRDEKARVGRLLASRGFDSETVRKVIYEKL